MPVFCILTGRKNVNKREPAKEDPNMLLSIHPNMELFILSILLFIAGGIVLMIRMFR